MFAFFMMFMLSGIAAAMVFGLFDSDGSDAEVAADAADAGASEDTTNHGTGNMLDDSGAEDDATNHGTSDGGGTVFKSVAMYPRGWSPHDTNVEITGFDVSQDQLMLPRVPTYFERGNPGIDTLDITETDEGDTLISWQFEGVDTSTAVRLVGVTGFDPSQLLVTGYNSSVDGEFTTQAVHDGTGQQVTLHARSYAGLGLGDDRVTLDGAGSVVDTGAGDDSVTGTPGQTAPVWIFTGSGNDRVAIDDGLGMINTGAGDDTIEVDPNATAHLLQVDVTNDRFTYDHANAIVAGAGADTISAGLSSSINPNTLTNILYDYEFDGDPDEITLHVTEAALGEETDVQLKDDADSLHLDIADDVEGWILLTSKESYDVTSNDTGLELTDLHVTLMPDGATDPDEGTSLGVVHIGNVGV